MVSGGSDAPADGSIGSRRGDSTDSNARTGSLNAAPANADSGPPDRVQTRAVHLPGRGTVIVLECPGPPGADTLFLIHGVTLTAELNWLQVLPALGRHFRVIAIDQRGHGAGLLAAPRFSLEDCADDLAALARTLGIPRFIAVGYSMGGMIAQLLHRRHSSLLAGLVLCSTARNVRGSPVENLVALALPSLILSAHYNPFVQVLGAQVVGAVLLGHIDDPLTARWARAQMSRTSLATAIAAMHAVCDFTSHRWIGEVKVPTAVVITTRDRTVAQSRQRRLAAAIPHAVVYELDADHGVCITAPERFARILLEACTSLVSAAAPAPATPALADPV